MNSSRAVSPRQIGVNEEQFKAAVDQYSARLDQVYEISEGKLAHLLTLALPMSTASAKLRVLEFIEWLEKKLFDNRLPKFSSTHGDWKNCFFISSGNRWYTYQGYKVSTQLQAKLPTSMEAGTLVIIYKAAHLVATRMKQLTEQASVTSSSSTHDVPASRKRSSTTAIVHQAMAEKSKQNVWTDVFGEDEPEETVAKNQIRAKRPLILAGLRALREQEEADAKAADEERQEIEERTAIISRPF